MWAGSKPRCYRNYALPIRNCSKRYVLPARFLPRSKKGWRSSSTASSGLSLDASGARLVPSLKALRLRIRSVRSTQKITSAMKVVAASRLRRAVQQVGAARPYAQRMDRVLGSLAGRMADIPGAPPLLVGSGRDDTHLLVVATSDRGLAGGFNSSILREARRRIRELENAGKTVKILTIGRRGRDGLRREYGRLIHDSLTDVGRRSLSFDEARDISTRILSLFESGGFDV